MITEQSELHDDWVNGPDAPIEVTAEAVLERFKSYWLKGAGARVRVLEPDRINLVRAWTTGATEINLTGPAEEMAPLVAAVQKYQWRPSQLLFRGRYRLRPVTTPLVRRWNIISKTIRRRYSRW